MGWGQSVSNGPRESNVKQQDGSRQKANGNGGGQLRRAQV